ncbi:flavin reductase family protein [Streptomyces sp. NPDC014894]|uniref:flavin reductase family protein n=1 Tax=Streptomyces sp. NPDC014894 TaxID=3364931 RepID=UPI0036FA07C8
MSDPLPLPAQRPSTAVPSGPGTPLPGSADLLRSVFRRHAAGVAVITAGGERPAGFTATSLASVSADPPAISFGVASGSFSGRAVARAAHVGVHILGEHQEELAALFARGGADRFAPPTRWSAGPEGVPVLDGVQGWLVCRVISRTPVGGHCLVVARAVAGRVASDGRPLLYHQGRFNALRD